jgi:hypothetical protein
MQLTVNRNGSTADNAWTRSVAKTVVSDVLALLGAVFLMALLMEGLWLVFHVDSSMRPPL